MSRPIQEREHGIASYNKGCRCEFCKKVVRDKSRKRRRALRALDAKAVHWCRYNCGDKFQTERNRASHEGRVHGCVWE